VIPVDFISLLPPGGGGFGRQIRDGLALLHHRLRSSGRSEADVLTLTFFIEAKRPAAYRRRKERLLGLVREACGPEPPPASVVAQSPERGRMAALEAVVLRSPGKSLRLARKSSAGGDYVVVTGAGTRQVHAAGIASSGGRTTAAQAGEALAKLEAILRKERLSWGHVVRQWNYIQRISEYQAFNDVRARTYEPARFRRGYPAATGIGQSAGGVVLEAIALSAGPEVRVEPVSNPRQVDAHRYSEKALAGSSRNASPKFERAKRVSGPGGELLFVSGTAAVLGEKSVFPGDVAAQTRTAIDHIASLTGGRKLSSLRAYVKKAKDVAVVRRICRRAFGPIPALYVQADVCRPELLVELEGVLLASGHCQTASGSL